MKASGWPIWSLRRAWEPRPPPQRGLVHAGIRLGLANSDVAGRGLVHHLAAGTRVCGHGLVDLRVRALAPPRGADG